MAAGSTLALEAKVEDVAAGTRLLVDDEGGATTLVTVTGIATTSQLLGGLTDSVSVLTVTPSIAAIADRRRVTVYELVGTTIPFWGSAFPERLTGGTVFLPGRLVDAETIEVGRTIAAGEFEPGRAAAARGRLAGADRARRRRGHGPCRGDGRVGGDRRLLRDLRDDAGRQDERA